MRILPLTQDFLWQAKEMVCTRSHINHKLFCAISINIDFFSKKR